MHGCQHLASTGLWPIMLPHPWYKLTVGPVLYTLTRNTKAVCTGIHFEKQSGGGGASTTSSQYIVSLRQNAIAANYYWKCEPICPHVPITTYGWVGAGRKLSSWRRRSTVQPSQSPCSLEAVVVSFTVLQILHCSVVLFCNYLLEQNVLCCVIKL